MKKETKMSKKLKIQFWRAKLALAMQILEQEGLPQRKIEGRVRIMIQPAFEGDIIFLHGEAYKYNSCPQSICFNSNAGRDEYLQKAVNAITDELFTVEGELKIGEMCEVRDDEDDNWEERKLITILPEKYNERFIVEMEDYPTEHYSWSCARPLAKRTEPTIEECGNVVTYTWEEK